jgi:hypothetical protein
MSEPSSSPYKSKLFNFLNRQTIRVKEEVKRTIRQAKVAASWGVQVVMYPIYLIFQSTRYTSHRFQQTVRETWKRLQPTTEPQHPPETDRPIQELIEVIEQFQLDQALFGIIPSITVSDQSIVPYEETPQAIALRGGKLGYRGAIGVASDLKSRKLVLVTSNYKILDILTPEQQKKLMQRIVWEIAVYKHRWRLWALQGRKFSPKIAPRNKNKVLPPVRWFWETMAWLQTSEVAIAIDLFQESSLIPTIVTENPPPLAVSPNVTEILKQLEIPGMAVVEQQLNSLDLAIAKVETYLLSEPSPSDNQPIARVKRDGFDRENRDRFRLQSLIWAAIDYFFGSQHSKETKLPSNPATSPQTLPLPSNYDLEEVDPWLSWTDLFPEPPIIQPPSSTPKTSNLPPSKSRPRPKISGKTSVNPKLSAKTEVPPRSVWSLIKSWFGLDDAPQLPKDLALAGGNQIKAEEDAGKLAIDGQNLGESIVTTSNSPSLEYTPNWIETEATPKGYVKHPLQKLLEWLDRIMLSVEGFFERVYLTVKKWFKS